MAACPAYVYYGLKPRTVTETTWVDGKPVVTRHTVFDPMGTAFCSQDEGHEGNHTSPDPLHRGQTFSWNDAMTGKNISTPRTP
jgi:hypothetical protein